MLTETSTAALVVSIGHNLRAIRDGYSAQAIENLHAIEAALRSRDEHDTADIAAAAASGRVEGSSMTAIVVNATANHTGAHNIIDDPDGERICTTHDVCLFFGEGCGCE